MKKTAVIFLLIAMFAVSALAQKADDSKDVMAVVEKMFDEMAAHNPAGIVALWTAEANLAAAIKNKEGKSIIRTFTVDAFSKNFAVKKNEIRESMYTPEIKLFGDLALIFGRYVFFIDGKVSHCGVNAFHLVRTDTGWKITGASTTMEPQGCTENEKTMKPGK